MHLPTYAIEIARRSPNRRYQTGAVICSPAGAVIATGWAHIPCMRMTRLWGMHAELWALRRAGRRRTEGAICYIANISGATGGLKFGRPCVDCARALQHAGIERVIFTDPDQPSGWREVDLTQLDEPLKDYYRTREWTPAVV